MKKIFQKFFEATSWNGKLTPMPAALPTAMIALGVAITPLWAGVLVWFVFHWLFGRFWY